MSHTPPSPFPPTHTSQTVAEIPGRHVWNIAAHDWAKAMSVLLQRRDCVPHHILLY